MIKIMNDRILEILKIKELTALKFAEIMNVQASSISHITSGRNKPSFDFIAKLLEKFPDINPDWLILGEGEMIRDEYTESQTSNVGQDAGLFNSNSEGLLDGNNVTGSSLKKIERVVILYSDGTFDVYHR